MNSLFSTPMALRTVGTTSRIETNVFSKLLCLSTCGPTYEKESKVHVLPDHTLNIRETWPHDVNLKDDAWIFWLHFHVLCDVHILLLPESLLHTQSVTRPSSSPSSNSQGRRCSWNDTPKTLDLQTSRVSHLRHWSALITILPPPPFTPLAAQLEL